MGLSSAGSAARIDKYTSIIGLGDVISVTLVADTSAYATGDVLVIPQEITGFFRVSGGRTRLQSVRLVDEDLQSQSMDLIFLDADGSLGTINAAFGPTDAVSRTILATLTIATSDYVAGTANSIAAGEVNILMEAASGSTSVWLGAVCRSGTPTHTASGLRLKLGVSWE